MGKATLNSEKLDLNIKFDSVVVVIARIVLVRVSTVVIKYCNQNKLVRERKRLLHLTACSPSFREVRVGTQGRNRWRGHGEIALTGLLSCCVQPSYHTQDHQPKGGTTHHRLGTLTSITN